MSSSDPLADAVVRLLKPLAGLLVEHGIPFRTFSEWAKFAFVEAGEAQGPVEGRKMSTSRLSVLTGLTRKDIARIRDTQRPTAKAERSRHHRAARVVTGWIREDRYTDDCGLPLELPIDGDEPSFDSLVREFGGDVPTRAVLDELERVETAQVIDKKRVKLLARAYVPRTSEPQALEVLGTDVGGLIQTIQHNLTQGTAPKFQRRVLYDNLPEESLPIIHQFIVKHGQTLLERLDAEMAKHDRDANPSAEGTGRHTAGMGVFYFDNRPVSHRDNQSNTSEDPEDSQ